MIAKLLTALVIVSGGASFIGCNDLTSESIPVDVSLKRYSVEIATFASPHDAEATARALEARKDGSTLLLIERDQATFEALITRSTRAWLLKNPKLVNLKKPEPAVTNGCPRNPGDDRIGPCFCDGACWIFGDCCWIDFGGRG